jgi:hypothetical protein
MGVVGVGSTETTERIGKIRPASSGFIGAKGVSAIELGPNVLSLLGEAHSYGVWSWVGSRSDDLRSC